MKKIHVIFVILIALLLLLGTYSNAAEQASISVSASPTSVNKNDSVNVDLVVTNNSVSDGISVIYGVISFNDEAFEISTLDYDEAMNNAGSLMKKVLESFEDSGCKLAYVDDDWCIAIIEEEGAYAFTALTLTDEIEENTDDYEIGTITFNVLNTAKSQNTKIDFTNVSVSSAASDATSDENEELKGITVEDVHTETITIGGASSDDDNIVLLGDEGENDNKLYYTYNSQVDSDVSDQSTPYTGVEDLIPFFIITAVIGFFGYIKYKKYQGI